MKGNLRVGSQEPGLQSSPYIWGDSAGEERFPDERELLAMVLSMAVT